MRSTQVRVTTVPEGEIRPENFELATVELPSLRPGEVLVGNTWTSVDPGLRLRLRRDAPQGYFPAFAVGRAMDGIVAVGVVEESLADDVPVGSTVWHSYGWRSHAVVAADEVAMGGLASLRVLDVDRAPAQAYLGPLGPMGLTAYAGLEVMGALAGNGTIWVSAAAGAVGSLACQVAKLSGLRVIASAGSDRKVEWLREIGVDAVFNWRTQAPVEALRDAAPDGLDFCFDNVGGGHLEAALEVMRDGGAIALCGAVSEYDGEPVGPRNLFLATSKNLTLRGFRGSAHVSLLDEMQARLGAWIREGRLVYRESVYEGLEAAPRALADTLAGRTAGKTLVRI